MTYVISALFFITGLINFAPIVGVLSNSRLAQLYGVDIPNADLSLLLRHRALLLGIVGLLLIYAAFRADIRGLASAAGIMSMLPYVVLALSIPTSNSSLLHIAWIDIGAITLLIIGYGLHRLYV